jgi:hypothetical protein
MKGGAPKQLGYQTVLATMSDNTQALAMLGMFDGTEAEGLAALQPLLNTPGANLFYMPGIQSYAWLNEHLLDDNLHPPVDGLVEFKKAGYIANSYVDWVQAVKYFLSSPNIYNIVVIEPYGGRINQVPVSDSAFIHRDVYMDFFVDSFFFESGQPTSRAQAEMWLEGFMNLMAGNFNGHMYQNYPIRDFPGYPTAYWDQNTFNQLRKVKTYRDPDNFFRFEQSIPPDTDASNLKSLGSAAYMNRFRVTVAAKAKPKVTSKSKKVKARKVTKTASSKLVKTLKGRKVRKSSEAVKTAKKRRSAKRR